MPSTEAFALLPVPECGEIVAQDGLDSRILIVGES